MPLNIDLILSNVSPLLTRLWRGRKESRTLSLTNAHTHLTAALPKPLNSSICRSRQLLQLVVT